MLRSLIFYILLILPTIVLSLAATILSPLDKSGRLGNAIGITWGRIMIWLAGVRIEADLSAVPPGGPYIFMVNHQSYMDIPVLFTVLRRYNIRFVAKESLYSIPIFGRALRRAGHVSIDRANRRKAMQSIDAAVAMARSGISIIIFPEGTRSSDFSQLGDFKIGGIILALKCGCPVVPLVMAGSGEILPRNSLWTRPGRVVVKAMPPINAAERYVLKDREAFKDDLRTVMNSAYLEVRSCLQTTAQ